MMGNKIPRAVLRRVRRYPGTVIRKSRTQIGRAPDILLFRLARRFENVDVMNGRRAAFESLARLRRAAFAGVVGNWSDGIVAGSPAVVSFACERAKAGAQAAYFSLTSAAPPIWQRFDVRSPTRATSAVTIFETRL